MFTDALSSSTAAPASRNLVYRNECDHRDTAAKDSTPARSTHEQIGCLLNHQSRLYPGTPQQFLDFTQGEFVGTRIRLKLT